MDKTWLREATTCGSKTTGGREVRNAKRRTMHIKEYNFQKCQEHLCASVRCLCLLSVLFTNANSKKKVPSMEFSSGISKDSPRKELKKEWEEVRGGGEKLEPLTFG